MKLHTLIVSAVCVLSLVLATNSHAIQLTTLPALDLKADLFQVPNSGGIPTSATYVTVWGSPYQHPTWGAPATINPYPIGIGGIGYGYVVNTFNDWIVIGGGGGSQWENSTNRYMAAAAYIQYDDTSTPSDFMTIFTVYGNDTDPNTPGSLAMSGFNPNDPIPQLADEVVTGPSGAAYPAGPGQLVAIADLHTVLGAAADLSMFGGSTDSHQVWVFQTQIPFSEMGVPEPTSLALLALGGLATLRRRR